MSTETTAGRPVARVASTEAVVSDPSPAVQRDARGRFTAGSGRPSRRRPGAQPANLNASRNAWATFWRRRALRPEDRWILPLLDAYASALLSDKGGSDATAGERSMIELATLARGCTMLVLAQAATSGGIVGNRRSASIRGVNSMKKISDSDIGANLGRFMQVERGALQAIGLERRAREVSPWALLDAEGKQATGPAPASAPASIVAPAGNGAPKEES